MVTAMLASVLVDLCTFLFDVSRCAWIGAPRRDWCTACAQLC